MAKKKRGSGKKSEPAAAPAAADERIDPTVLASVLAAEYPLIDPSLVHAMLLDYDPDSLSRHLDEIRDQLGILEATSVPDADEPASFVPPHSPEIGPVDSYEVFQRLEAIETCETSTSGRASPFHSAFAPSTDLGTTITSTASTSSPSMCSDGDDPQTEQELLSGFFPSLPQKCIREALASEPSLDAAIDHLLSVELIRGVQRSGVWPDEPEELEEDNFTVLTKSRRGSSNSGHSRASADIRPSKSKPATKPKKAATVTIPLVDTLQRRSAPPTRSGSASGSSTPRTPGVPPADVWSAFASLAAYLAEALPRAQAPFFTSFLHSPDYTCAHEAVLAALSTLASTSRIDALSDDAATIVEDIFGMSLADEDAHDLELCLRAAEGDVGVVMDLMDLLNELTWWPDYEAAKEFGRDPFEQLAELERALPAAKPAPPKAALQTAEPQSTEQEWITTRVSNPNRLQRPKSEEPKKRERVIPGSRAVTGGFKAANPFAGLPTSSRWAAPGSTPKGTIPWQTVAKQRVRAPRGAHPLAASIPAYARGMLPHDQRPGTLAAAQALESTIPGQTTAAMCYERSNVEWRRREEAIRAAARHFKSGGRRDAAGAVAGHYAAQARAAGDAARQWELRGARMVIDAQMERTGHTVDLHYATVDQAITLAVETAKRWWSAVEAERAASPGTVTRPLIVVTGKGQHSVGQRGVLGPAVAKALADDGWRIEKCEGYVAVKGRR